MSTLLPSHPSITDPIYSSQSHDKTCPIVGSDKLCSIITPPLSFLAPNTFLWRIGELRATQSGPVCFSSLLLPSKSNDLRTLSRSILIQITSNARPSSFRKAVRKFEAAFAAEFLQMDAEAQNYNAQLELCRYAMLSSSTKCSFPAEHLIFFPFSSRNRRKKVIDKARNLD